VAQGGRSVTLNEVIARLEELRRKHGGDDRVIVEGLYSSSADIEKPEYITRERTDYDSYISIKTDLMTG
jgi:hypothetical protein